MSKLEPEYADALGAWQQDPSKTNTGTLLRQVDPVLNNAIRSYAAGMSKSPTIKSRARLLAADAFKNYQPEKGSLRSHLLSRLQRLRRVAAGERQIMRMPEQVAMDQIRTNEATTELQERLGRPPSDRDLADHLGLSFKRLAHIRQGVRPVAEGTLTRAGPEEGTGQYAPEIRSNEQNFDNWLEFVYEDLDSTNQYILERVAGMHGRTRIAPVQVAKELGVTPGAISHRMAQIQRKLDMLEEAGGL